MATMQSSRNSKLIKRRNKSRFLEDHMSTMPDEILVSILSLLSTKEAVRTSILSRRWRCLWKFTGVLNFDESLLVFERKYGFVEKSLEVERLRFVNGVNQVLKLHKSQTLDEFRVFFYVNEKSHKCDLDNWMKFAFQKRAKRIEFNLPHSVNQTLEVVNYTVTPLFLCNYNLSFLMVLHLNKVDITAEVIEHLLSSCPLLEVLSVKNANSLTHVKVSGLSLKLKCLEIFYCIYLKSIEICNVNLVSLKYGGPIASISVKETPCLVQATFMGHHACFLIENIHKHPYPLCLSQLETLTLHLLGEAVDTFPKFPKLRNVKQLELVLRGWPVDSVLGYMSILKLVGIGRASVKGKPKVLKDKHPHKRLEVFEFMGFLQSRIDIELLHYVLDNTRALRKIIIDPRCASVVGSNPLIMGYDIRKLNLKFAARNYARSLQKKLTSGVELVIL